MVKKCVLSCLAFLLVVSFSFAAQPPRNPEFNSVGKTVFTNLALTGLDNNGTDGIKYAGTPAYIEMVNGEGTIYYLYVGSDGKLRIASVMSVGYLASPSTVGWSDTSGTVVGVQGQGAP